MSKQEKVKKPFYKKWWVWLLAIVVIGVAANGGDEEAVNNEPEKVEVSAPATSEVKKEAVKEEVVKEKEKPKAEEKPKEETITISASDLYSAYNDNEIAADQKYKGKQLEVSGTVQDIGKDIFDSIYVTLETAELMGSIQVYFEKGQEDAIAALSKGQELTVVGKGDGFLIMTVTLKKSLIK